MIERRSFFKKALAFLPAALLPASIKAAEPPSESEAFQALGYLSRLLPGDYVLCPPPIKLAEDIRQYVLNSLERREIQLAGVSVAAAGWAKDSQQARPGDWGWHPAYQDTLDLRRKFESAINLLRERIPAGQTIVLYPCGCSAIGNLPVGEEMPLQCGSCPPHTSATSIVYRPHEKRPTIQDLEAILAQDGNGLPVRVII